MTRDMKILLLVGAVIALMVIVFLIALFTAPAQVPVSSPLPTPISSIFRGINPGNIVNPNYVQPSIAPYTPQNDYSESYIKKAQEIENSERAEREKGQQVGKLLSLVPYKGTYFSISFDYAQVNFVVELNKSHLSEANQEFDAFLIKNGIQSRSWIKNLVVN